MTRRCLKASAGSTTAAGTTSTPAPRGKAPRGRSSFTPHRRPAIPFKSCRPRGRAQNTSRGGAKSPGEPAALLAIARACASLKERPARSILFAAVGAEEQGLLGSQYLAEHPPIAAGNLAAVINIDGVNIIGPTH